MSYNGRNVLPEGNSRQDSSLPGYGRHTPSSHPAMSTAAFLESIRQPIYQRNSQHVFKDINVPEIQLGQLKPGINRLIQMCSTVEQLLGVYALQLGEGTVRRWVAICATVDTQRSLLDGPSPRYILDLITVKTMQRQMQGALDMLQRFPPPPSNSDWPTASG